MAAERVGPFGYCVVMQHGPPITLEYRSPESPITPWLLVLRFLFLGPVTGLLVGFAQATSAIVICRLHGKPYPYFHGSTLALYILLVGGGGFVGVGYGLAASAFERIRHVRTPLPIVIPGLLLVASGLAAVQTLVYLREPRPPIDYVLFHWPHAGAVAVGLLLSALAARRAA